MRPELRKMHPDAFELQETQRIDRIFGTDRTRAQIAAGMPAAEILSVWEPERRAFERLREGYLLYP